MTQLKTPTRLEKYLENHPKAESSAIAFIAALDHLEKSYPQVANHIIQELKDQRSNLKLIASENYSSLSVQLAMGNLLTDKYAEGHPYHRFYAGCDNVDALEDLAVSTLKKLFKAECAYVQPHSGADANLVALWSILIHRVQSRELEALGNKSVDELTAEEHEKIRKIMLDQKMMGMSLNSGGHLTHGYRHNVSSKMMQSVQYDVDPTTGRIEYHKLAEQVKKEKPLVLMVGYSSYPRLINFAKMREIADSTGAVLLVDMAHFAGLVAGGVFQGEYNPVPYADIVTSTTHKTLRGPRGGMILAKKEYEEVINKGCPLVLGGPLPHVIAAKAIAFQEASTPEFQVYAQNIVANAKELAESLKREGIDIVTGGTDNHLVIIDLSSLNITGRQAESALRQAGLTVNRNSIPYDKNGAWYTTGIRLGTPAITTLGMGIAEMQEVASLVALVLKNTSPEVVEKTGKLSKARYKMDPKVEMKVKERVNNLISRFPLYSEIEIEI